MQGIDIVRESKVKESFRNSKVQGMFDIPKSDKEVFRLQANIEIPEDYQIGLIVGPSGSGKTLLASQIMGMTDLPNWSIDDSVVDCFSNDLNIKQITGSLTGVGFSDTRCWLRPHSVLSNGQKFRADLARMLAENKTVVFDEFTSVVDRTVAKATSNSLRKYLSANIDKKFVGVSCHYDIIEWLQPDWVFDTEKNEMITVKKNPKSKLKSIDAIQNYGKYSGLITI